MAWNKKPIPWNIYPNRVRSSQHANRLSTCRICQEPIKVGDCYVDGGSGRRAHIGCIKGYVHGDEAKVAAEASRRAMAKILKDVDVVHETPGNLNQDDPIIWVCETCYPSQGHEVFSLGRANVPAPCEVCGNVTSDLNAVCKSWAEKARTKRELGRSGEGGSEGSSGNGEGSPPEG